MSRYAKAKLIALGLREDTGESASAGGGAFALNASPELRMEMPFQFFDKKLAPPPAVLAQKAALSLFSEYSRDRERAADVLRSLSEAVGSGNPKSVVSLLKKNPAAEWLSFVFLEPEELQTLLWEPVGEADAECRAAVVSALESELSRLHNFTELLKSIIERLSEGS